MFKRVVSPLVLMLALVCAAPLALAADPSIAQVYEAANSGHVAQAEQMMAQVLRDHPRSAKAHYVAAEVYARARDFARARQELSTAESIEPGLQFVGSDKVQALRQELSQGSSAGRYVPYAAPRHSSFPWVPVLILVAVVGVLWAIFSRRNAAATTTYPQYAGAGPGPMGPPGVGYPGYPGGPVVGGGGGSGIMGALGTGLAVGAGVAAGEELVRHVLEPGREGYVPPPPPENYVDPSINSDMGGNDFGVSDPGSWDDNSGGDSFGGGSGGDDWT
jgi:hypothetical protein